MPVIPSGNISLLELIKFAFEQKYGNATVGPLEVDEALDISHQWEAVGKAVSKAIKAHDLMLYVESPDGTEKRLTYQQSDEDLVWGTLLTGKLEHEPDPTVFQRTVYVRIDDASTFLKEFTRKGIEQPDTATDGTDEGKVAELSGLVIVAGGASSGGRPTLKDEIEVAYRDLREVGQIDFDAPKNKIYKPIREKVREHKGDSSLQRGLGKEAIRKVISPLFEADKNARTTSP